MSVSSHILNVFAFLFVSLVVDVPGYQEVISNPRDYGTIRKKLKKGEYSPSPDGRWSTENDDLHPMQSIMLNALIDVEQVHHNWFLFNLRGSAYYRAGEIHANKWKAYSQKYILEKLPDSVQLSLAAFQKSCDKKRLEKSHGCRSFQSTRHHHNMKAVAVFDPDTKRIVKQYRSKASAKIAALMLYDAGYACEYSSLKNVDFADDPTKPLFGYQWLLTEKLRAGKFNVKPCLQSADLASPTPSNIVISKEDKVSNAIVRHFESEESAYKDWLLERSASLNAPLDQTDTETSSLLPDFVKEYLDGDKSVGGIIWNRVVCVAASSKMPVPKTPTDVGEKTGDIDSTNSQMKNPN